MAVNFTPKQNTKVTFTPKASPPPVAPADNRNFLQKVSTETAKAGVRSVLGLGSLGQSIQQGVGTGVDFLSGGRTNLAETAKGGVFDNTSPTGQMAERLTERAPGAAGLLGTGLAFGAEMALGGRPVAQRALGAFSSAKSSRAVESVIEAVSPKLSAKEAADALARRGGEFAGGFIKKAQPIVDKTTERIANTIQQHVPDFKPGGSLIENINTSRSAVSNLAQGLKADVEKVAGNSIYSFKELGSRLRGIEKPILIASDTTLDNAYNRVVTKAMEIAQKNGGKIPSLFDTRKQFDQFVERQFPDLYSNDRLTPMRTAIMDIRREMNKFVEENLPKDTDFIPRLSVQSDIYEAIENMAQKAASGPAKEIGSSVKERFIKKHPIATGAIGALGGMIGYNTLFNK